MECFAPPCQTELDKGFQDVQCLCFHFITMLYVTEENFVAIFIFLAYLR